MARIEELTRLIPPPQKPFPAEGDWAAVETRLGLVLPSDFKQIITTYGSGKFFGFISVHSPFATNQRWSLEYQLRLQSENFRQYAREGFGVPFPIYPERSGLVEFGTTENCQCLTWLSKGKPEDWSLVIWEMISAGPVA